MSAILLITSAGDIVLELYTDETPNTCKNFIKLCYNKYYHNTTIFNVQPEFIIQLGDPTETGNGGDNSAIIKHIDNEIHPKITFDRPYRIAMTTMVSDGGGGGNIGSQFFITLRGNDMEFINNKYIIFGEVTEGHDIINLIADTPLDDSGRPLKNIRILHTYILINSFIFDHPPPQSPKSGTSIHRQQDELIDKSLDINSRPEYYDIIDETDTMSDQQKQEFREHIEAENRAVRLEMLGDLSDAREKPPENILFVCKLNPATEADDLEIIFSRFGTIRECEIIKDYITGDSLQYGFVEFSSPKEAETAYYKMNNVVVDDRRIKVDFSQSMAKNYKSFHVPGKWGVSSSSSSSRRSTKQPTKHKSHKHIKKKHKKKH